jgi:ribosome-binding factor A
MSYRVQRVASIIRETVGHAISERLSDPRISRFTSVTRVSVSADLQTAEVYISVMGDESEEGRTMKGLTSARGLIQSLVAGRLDIRRCPVIRFHLDPGIKKGVAIVQELDRLSAERQSREKTSSTESEPTDSHPSAEEGDRP